MEKPIVSKTVSADNWGKMEVRYIDDITMVRLSAREYGGEYTHSLSQLLDKKQLRELQSLITQIVEEQDNANR